MTWMVSASSAAPSRKRRLHREVDAFERTAGCARGLELAQAWIDGTPPANVWLGTTVEDQQRAKERIPELLKMPAVVRFLSVEPLLERVDLDQVGLLWRLCSTCEGRMSVPVVGGGKACPDCFDHQGVENAGISWVIIGGESGHGARPFGIDWARELLRQCRASGVAPFIKQLGARPRGACGKTSIWWGDDTHTCDGRCALHVRDPAGADPAEWPADLRVREVPGAPALITAERAPPSR